MTKDLFMPQDVASLALEEVKHRKETSTLEGLRTHIGNIDADLLPFGAGDLIAVVGNTSNGKSLLMRYIMAMNVKRFQERQRGEFGIFVSYEQSVEQQGIQDMAELSGVKPFKMHAGTVSDDELELLMSAYAKRASMPLAVIGHSSRQRAELKKGRPLPTMDRLDELFTDFVNTQDKRPSLIVIDYLQRIPLSGKWQANPTLGFSENVDKAKDLAFKMGCPVFLGTQAKQEVTDRKWPMPNEYDGYFTSNLAHTPDYILSVMMPKTRFPLGSSLETKYTNGKDVVVTDNLMAISVVKQKWGPAPYLTFSEIQDDWATIKPLVFTDVNQWNV